MRLRTLSNQLTELPCEQSRPRQTAREEPHRERFKAEENASLAPATKERGRSKAPPVSTFPLFLHSVILTNEAVSTRHRANGDTLGTTHLGAKGEVFGGEVGRARAALQEEPLGLELYHLGLVGVAEVLEEVLLGELRERVKPLCQER